MKTGATEIKTWQKTNVANLYVHKSGGYYYRAKIGGKQIWESLKTKSKSVAVERVASKAKSTRAGRKVADGAKLGKLTIGQAIIGALALVESNPDVTENTKQFRRSGAKALLVEWPELAKMDPRKLTPAAVKSWSERVRNASQAHTPRGAKTPMRNSKGCSVTKHNGMLDVLRMALDFAVDSGAAFSNPARDQRVKRPSQPKKDLILPSTEGFRSLIAEMRKIAGNASHAADLCELLAYTGARQNEARNLLWSDVDFARNRITLRVTKNSEARTVPMLTECRALLERMKTAQPFASQGSPVAQVFEAQKSIDNAARRAGIERLTHHDFRHLFATVTIEAGVDIPTVAKLLGHKDGGALAMKTYGHLRDDHAQTMMSRVSFRDQTPEAGKVVSIAKEAA